MIFTKLNACGFRAKAREKHFGVRGNWDFTAQRMLILRLLLCQCLEDDIDDGSMTIRLSGHTHDQ